MPTQPFCSAKNNNKSQAMKHMGVSTPVLTNAGMRDTIPDITPVLIIFSVPPISIDRRRHSLRNKVSILG